MTNEDYKTISTQLEILRDRLIQSIESYTEDTIKVIEELSIKSKE